MLTIINLLELASGFVGAVGGLMALVFGVRQARRIRRSGDDTVATKVLSGEYVVPVGRDKEAA